MESATTGWQIFSVTFDPRVASRDQVEKAIENGGGVILAGPPTPTAGQAGGLAAR